MEQKYILSFSISKKQFTEFLLLLGALELKARDSLQSGLSSVVIHGVSDHRKFGISGIEDGNNHQFRTQVVHDSHVIDAFVTLNSQDNGATYQGSITYKYDRSDWDSEH